MAFSVNADAGTALSMAAIKARMPHVKIGFPIMRLDQVKLERVP